MDAVKSTIEQLGGRVSIASKLGEGTQVSLRLPATAALTTVLVIRVGAERVAVPLDVVVETLKLPTASIMPVGLGRAFVLRDRTLPLLDLGQLLGLCRAPQRADAKVLVVDSGEGLVGLEVDDFSERLQVLLRPMAGILANVPGVSGTTLLGDGSVLLTVNLSEMIG
jgi:two-component system chemotaxis sensor kinase CheA